MGIYEKLSDLAACLCNQIEADGSPPPCFCGVVPGDHLELLYGGNCASRCGLAWVRLIDAYPAASVATPDGTVPNCATGLGFTVEMGIVRCFPILDDGANPSPQELAESTEQQMKDMVTMQRAVVCCNAINSHDVLLGAYTPVGPDGGILGGGWSLSMVE